MNRGFGLGLRPPFYKEAAHGEIGVDWFELITENFMVAGGNPLRVLDGVRASYPVALHGVSMNLGGSDPLDDAYLAELAKIMRRAEPMWISDHLCWTRHGGRHLHDLLPLPFTEQAIEHVASRIRQVQDRLGVRILVENVASYVVLEPSAMPESEFVTAVAEQADCFLLLDVNNVVVSAHNQGFDPHAYVDAMPAARVRQIHLAGHSTSGALCIDTHDHPIAEETWALYRHAMRRLGEVAVMIERDDAIPPISVLVRELDLARVAAAEARAA